MNLPACASGHTSWNGCTPFTNEIERLNAGFFTGESLSEHERGWINRYCEARGLAYLARRQWAEEVLFQYGYYSYGAVVGFNLPFSLSRVAVRASVIGCRVRKSPEGMAVSSSTAEHATKGANSDLSRKRTAI